MKTIISTQDDCLNGAAAHVRRLLAEKPDAVIALSAMDDALMLYRELAGEQSLSKARLFSVAEFESGEGPAICHDRLRAALAATGAREGNCVFLSEENAGDYDARIAAEGGLDLAVLGIGVNARVGLNEPATPYASRTHRQKLAPATRRELAGLFGGEEKVPEYGLTMGIKTLVEAKEVLLIAFGEIRAKAVFDMLYGRDDSTVPAAFLQLPPNVTVYLDESAAAKL